MSNNRIALSDDDLQLADISGETDTAVGGAFLYIYDFGPGWWTPRGYQQSGTHSPGEVLSHHGFNKFEVRGPATHRGNHDLVGCPRSGEPVDALHIPISLPPSLPPFLPPSLSQALFINYYIQSSTSALGPSLNQEAC